VFCDAVARRFIDVTGSFEDAEGERLVRSVQLRMMERPEPTNGLSMLSLCYTPSFRAQKSMEHGASRPADLESYDAFVQCHAVRPPNVM
jgi:hypothetical protein